MQRLQDVLAERSLAAACRTGAGRGLAKFVLTRHPGPWEVGQMPANHGAQAFRRRVIGEFAQGRYTELIVADGQWQGVVQQCDVITPVPLRG